MNQAVAVRQHHFERVRALQLRVWVLGVAHRVQQAVDALQPYLRNPNKTINIERMYMSVFFLETKKGLRPPVEERLPRVGSGPRVLVAGGWTYDYERAWCTHHSNCTIL